MNLKDEAKRWAEWARTMETYIDEEIRRNEPPVPEKHRRNVRKMLDRMPDPIRNVLDID